MRNVVVFIFIGFFSASQSMAHEMEDMAHHAANFNAKFFLAMKDLQDKKWDGLDKQFSIGFDFDVRDPSWPISAFISSSFSFSGSRRDQQTLPAPADASSPIGTVSPLYYATDYYGFSWELDFGIRKYLMPGAPINPHISIGMAIMNVGISTGEWGGGWSHHDRWDGNRDSHDDFVYGLLLGAGWDMRAHHGRIGLDIRGVVGASGANIEYPSGMKSAKGDYIQIGITLGFGL